MTPVASQPPAKVLVIDDEDQFRDFLSKFLNRMGWQALVADNGRAGLELAAAQEPDLVLCDLDMPGMDGYEVLTRFQRDGMSAEVPFIFLTGCTEPRQMRQGMNLGADDYLTKPVNLDDLLTAIQTRLERRRARRQRQETQLERALQLFGGIAHDLRNPLFVLLGYTNLLKQGSGVVDAAAGGTHAVLDRMQRAALRMQAQVSEVLVLAKAKLRSLPFAPAPMDLLEFWEQLLLDQEGRQRLNLRAPAGPLPIHADCLRLQRAFENLLSNALKYSTGQVWVNLSVEPSAYRVEIVDQGIGIPSAEEKDVFSPFYRGSNTGECAGYGLGLPVVKDCIEQHGGTVTFRSECGKGTTFVVELPRPGVRGREEANGSGGCDQCSGDPNQVIGPANQSGALPSGLGSKLRGMIVDDDPLVRDVLRDVLASQGEVAIVAEAATLAEAGVLARQHEPQVVFLDVKLPDGSGFDLLPKLAAASAVVFVTSAEESGAHAFDCEAADFLLKPVKPERLQRAVARVRQRLAAQALAPVNARPAPKDVFLVKTLTGTRVSRVSEIERIIAYGEYSRVYWRKSQRTALLRKSLKQWLAELPAQEFVRVHRRAIVNLAALERVERLPKGRLRIHLNGAAEPIPVSLRLAPVLNRRLKVLRG